MTIPLMAGNWKMNKTIEEGLTLALSLKELLAGIDAVEIVLAPPFTMLDRIKGELGDSNIHLAAQNLFWKEEGAYTGEISPVMVKDVGCEYVILGHSERREYFKESDDIVNKKVLAALKNELNPILCVGETLEEREGGKTFKVVERQVRVGLEGCLQGQMRHVTIAYEPIWAIGTGKTAKPEEAEDVHQRIRDVLYELFEMDALEDTRIIYGGSVGPQNVDALMAQPNIDGALVGGASLKADSFERIVRFQAV
jgi:triosephosphate isomerase